MLGAAFAVVGCESEDTGDDFEISANRTSDSCGSGAIDSEEEWELAVNIETEDDVISWTDPDSGTTLEGTVSDDSFLITDSWTAIVTEGADAVPGCSVDVRVRYTGTLEGSSSDITNVDGEMTITYSEASGSDCDALIGTSDGFDELPCEVTYDLDGDRAD